jgi:dUTP pyrophosphatase
MQQKVFKYKKHHADARIDMPAKAGDVGYDIYAVEEVFIPAGENKEVPVGISFEPPEGYYFTIETRSGHGVRKSLRVHRGIVDTGFRGVLSVQVYNHTKPVRVEPMLGQTPVGYTVQKGEKIAQLVLHKVEVLPLEEQTELGNSERGADGFGSTGR